MRVLLGRNSNLQPLYVYDIINHNMCLPKQIWLLLFMACIFVVGVECKDLQIISTGRMVLTLLKDLGS